MRIDGAVVLYSLYTDAAVVFTRPLLMYRVIKVMLISIFKIFFSDFFLAFY
jgi:hypothetical protein